MFNDQISLLKLIISDWDNIKNGTSEHDWEVLSGLCINCELYDIVLELSPNPYSLQGNALWEIFREKMWSSFSGYSGNALYPLANYENYGLMSNLTQTPERLELAKCVLKFLEDYAEKHK